MEFLRSNTAVIVAVGPFYDKTDGVTIKTALTITNEKITLIAETDAGSAPTLILDNITGATSATANDLNYITNGDNGMMQLELAAADVNRVGRMKLSITDAANHVPVFHSYFVLPQAIYDWFTGVIVPLPANVTQLLGTAWLTPGVAGTPDVNAKLLGAAPVTATTSVTIPAASTLATTTGAVGSVTGAVGSVAGLTAATVHSDLDDIQARLPAALTANGNMKSSMVEILTTALTETAGLLAGGFKKFFNIASPVSTMDQIAAVTLTNTLTTYTGNTVQTGDSFARIGALGAGLTGITGVTLNATQTGVTIPTVTTVTNQLTGAAIATGVWQDATAGDFTTASSVGKSVMNGVALGTGLTVNDITTKTGYALTSAYDFAKGTAAMVESYAANGVAPTPVQAIMAMHQMLMDFGIASTSYTVKKLDNSTTAFVVTLDSATTPTAAART